MKPMFTKSALIFAVLVSLLSCTKSVNKPMRIPPVANAGIDQIIDISSGRTRLDGKKSVDPDGTIVKFKWSRVRGPFVNNLIGGNTSIATIEFAIEGLYEFELEITDNDGLTDKDTVQVAVNGPTYQTSPPVYSSQCVIPGSESVGKFSTYLVDAGAVVCDGKIYFSDGGVLDVFDPSTGQTSRVAVDFERTHAAIASLGNEIFLAGGYRYPAEINVPGTSYSRVDIYNTKSRNWHEAELSSARFGIKPYSTARKVYFAGGKTDVYTLSARVDIYDQVKKLWTSKDFGNGVNLLPVSVSNEVWFFKTGTSEVEIYDETNDNWRSWNSGRVVNGNDAILLNGKIYITGNQKVNVYDLTSKTWTEILLSEPKFYVPAVASNNKIAFVGGMTSWFVYSTLLEIYDPASNSWSVRYMNGDLGYPAIISYNNYLYCAGGMIDQENTYLSGICRLQL